MWVGSGSAFRSGHFFLHLFLGAFWLYLYSCQDWWITILPELYTCIFHTPLFVLQSQGLPSDLDIFSAPLSRGFLVVSVLLSRLVDHNSPRTVYMHFSHSVICPAIKKSSFSV